MTDIEEEKTKQFQLNDDDDDDYKFIASKFSLFWWKFSKQIYCLPVCLAEPFVLVAFWILSEQTDNRLNSFLFCLDLEIRFNH